MNVEYITQPEGAAAPLGKYSHIAIGRGNETIAIAGQTGVVSNGDLAGSGSLHDQTVQTFRNIELMLNSLGLGWDAVLKTTTYLVDANSIPEFMAARTQVFADIYPEGTYPPNTLLVVDRLVEERFHVEIEAFAQR